MIWLFLLLVFLLRVYHLPQLMPFSADEGGIALIMFNLFKDGLIFLVGPQTEWGGIFLGPFYYYLIFPAYILGRGNPIYPMAWQILLELSAVYLVYWLAQKYHSRTAGIVAALFAGLSFSLFTQSHWLSHPPLMFPVSMLIIYSLWKITQEGRERWWLGYSLFVAIALQLEVANAIWYLVMTPLLLVVLKKNLPRLKIVLGAVFIFLLSLVPQVLFEMSPHYLGGLRRPSLVLMERLLVDHSFHLSALTKLPLALDFYFQRFSRLFFSLLIIPWDKALFLLLLLVSIIGLWRWIRDNPRLKIMLWATLLVFLAPLVGLIFYAGTDEAREIKVYWFFGSYMPLILLVAVGLVEVFKIKWLKIVAILLIFLSVILNLLNIFLVFKDPVGSSSRIALIDKIAAVRWMEANSQTDYNLYYYRSYIPVSEDFHYLYRWLGGRWNQQEEREMVYLLWEDCYGVCPIRLKGIEDWWHGFEISTQLIEEETFGRMHVQKRLRN